MRVDIAGTQVREYEVAERPRGHKLPEVHHDRNAGQLARLDSPVDRVPLRTLVMRHLHADDDRTVRRNAHRGQPRVHVRQVLLDRPALHP
jgi:hypothetical protein